MCVCPCDCMWLSPDASVRLPARVSACVCVRGSVLLAGEVVYMHVYFWVCLSVYPRNRNFAKVAQQIRIQTCPSGTYKAATPACRQLLPGCPEKYPVRRWQEGFSVPGTPAGLQDCELRGPLPHRLPSAGHATSKAFPTQRGGGGGAEESRLPSRSQGPPLEGAQSPEGFLFPEAPRGARGEPKSLGSPNPRPLQEFEPRSCSLGRHVSA